MPFDTLEPHLQEIARHALALFRARYGSNGLKLDEGIDNSISWRPTFHLKMGKFRIIAVEVSENLFPEVLKVAAHDISHFDLPIIVYQACSLETFKSDPKHTKVNLLRRRGFGIVTVDDDGDVVVQHSSIPLLQFIAPDAFEGEIQALNAPVKVAFRSAYEAYLANESQGLQQSSQIVEGIVLSLAKQAAKKGVIKPAKVKSPLADIIDALYETKEFKDHRAALGGAREFVKQFRNAASHAPRTAAEAAQRIKKCRTGFLDAVNVCLQLRNVAHGVGYQVRIHTN